MRVQDYLATFIGQGGNNPWPFISHDENGNYNLQRRISETTWTPCHNHNNTRSSVRIDAQEELTIHAVAYDTILQNKCYAFLVFFLHLKGNMPL